MRTVVDREKVLELNRRFHDEVEAYDYDERTCVRHDGVAVARLVDELERVLGGSLPTGGVAVDVGAGTGNVAVKLASLRKFDRVVAVDISARMLDRASAAAAELGCPLETRVSDMTTLPFEDGSVSFVVGCAVLHHLAEPAALLAEVRRILVPGGRFVFIGEPSRAGALLVHALKAPWLVPLRALRAARGRPLQGWDHDHIDVHVFTPDDVQSLLTGFDRTRVVLEGFAGPAIDQGVIVLLQRMFGRSVRVADALRATRSALELSDRHVFERVLPSGFLASIKMSGARPA